MKSILIGTALASFSLLVGCGSASRTPAQYVQDTQTAFAEHEAAMKTCYEGVLANKPDAKGDVTIDFQWTAINGADQRFLTKGAAVVAGDGSAQKGEVNVKNSTAPEEVTKCVTDNLVNARIKPAGDGVGIGTWTFHFAPGEAPAATPAADAPKS